GAAGRDEPDAEPAAERDAARRGRAADREEAERRGAERQHADRQVSDRDDADGDRRDRDPAPGPPRPRAALATAGVDVEQWEPEQRARRAILDGRAREDEAGLREGAAEEAPLPHARLREAALGESAEVDRQLHGGAV